MVYYGVVSKGCQSCRRRKIKCDQQKPGCLKCEKSRTKCPGYRDLHEVLFRDESEKTIRKARLVEKLESVLKQQDLATSPKSVTSSSPTSKSKSLASSRYHVGIIYPIAQPINELGAQFFFAKYTINEAPFAQDYHDWLIQSYLEDGSSHVLRAAIEAVGSAGISNVYHAPQIALKSKELYCKALAAMKLALNNPLQATADTTLMAVILLGLYETVNFETSDRYCYWAAHIKAATALLELRGQDQFTRERGGQLYVLIRSQILSSCMQQHIAVPPALVQTGYYFEFSAIRKQWQHRNYSTSGSISEISFRVVNLQAAFQNRRIADPQVIRRIALEIDGDLETWRAGVPANWKYAMITAPEAASGTFDRKRHLYPNIWIADAWNNWRTLRILVNQIFVQNEVRSRMPENTQKSIAISVIHELSIDVCISIFSFINSPSLLSLIEPLYIVALEGLNARSVRYFALEQLRHIETSMGVRRAGLLANTIWISLNESPEEFVSVPDHF